MTVHEMVVDTEQEVEVDDDRDGLPPDVVTLLDSMPWDAERYDCGACASTVRDRETFPWEGQSVWLAPFEAPMALLEAGTGLSSGDNAKVASGFPSLREGLARVVVAHDLRDPATGDPLPQVWKNPDGALAWPSSLLFFVWSLAVSGEAPEARPKGSRVSRSGTATRRSGRASR